MKITAAKNSTTTTKGFLLCFRSFPMGGDAATINVDSDLNKSFPVIEKPKPKPKSSSSIDKESIDGNQKKTARRRILSKIVKAMAFQSSLSKKVRNGKIIQDRTDFRNQKLRRRSSTSSSSEEESISSSILSSSSSSSLSISSSSSIASSWNTSSSDSSRSLGSLSGRLKSFRSDSIEDEKKQNITGSSTQSNSTTDHKKNKIGGICLLLISLFVLVFWGKFLAIICTSTWFYFVSTTRRDDVGGVKERQMLIKLPVDIPSKEYKKKIIMEGFLERTRNQQHRGVFHHHQHY